jgi:hypothetical protein
MAVACGLVLPLYAGLNATHGAMWHAVLVFIIGALIAAPDSVLGGVGVADVCDRSGNSALLTSASGFVVRPR